MKTVLMNVKVDEKLKEDFHKWAKINDLSASQMIRNYMRIEVDKLAKHEAQKALSQPVKGKNNARKNR